MNIDMLMSGDGMTEGQSVADILHKAVLLLEDEDRWCQDFTAQDADGNWVASSSPLATRFSIAGAVGISSNAAGFLSPHILRFLDQLVVEYLGTDEPAGVYNEHDTGWFNDNFDHESVMGFLHEAHRRALCL